MSRGVAVAVLLAVCAVAGAFAQESLLVSDRQPKADGVIEKDEYSLAITVGTDTLYLSRSRDTLYAALSAPTTGWVAMGFGEPSMNGAVIYMGLVADGKQQFRLQQGQGHSHRDSGGTPEPIAAAVGEKGQETVLELALPATRFIAEGQGSLSLIVAHGGSDNFSAYHAFRAGGSVSLQ
jgi:hypothetical protein